MAPQLVTPESQEVHRRMQHLPVLHTQTISNNNFCRQPGHIIRFVTQFCHIVGTLFFSGIVLQRTKFILRRLQSIDVTLRPHNISSLTANLVDQLCFSQAILFFLFIRDSVGKFRVITYLTLFL